MTWLLPCRSVGAEVNYAIRFTDDADAERFIEKLSEEVEKRMANLGVQGRSLTFKLMRRKVIPGLFPALLGHTHANVLRQVSVG